MAPMAGTFPSTALGSGVIAEELLYGLGISEKQIAVYRALSKATLIEELSVKKGAEGTNIPDITKQIGISHNPDCTLHLEAKLIPAMNTGGIHSTTSQVCLEAGVSSTPDMLEILGIGVRVRFQLSGEEEKPRYSVVVDFLSETK